MRLLQSIALLASAVAAVAAKGWSFDDASVSVSEKGGSGSKETFKPTAPLPKHLTLTPSSSLKLLLTTTLDTRPKRAHQIFLRLSSPSTPSLADSFPLTAKENGKSTLSVAFKDIPTQLLQAGTLDAEIVIGSFGAGQAYKGKAFTIAVEGGEQKGEPQLRYGKQPEIHHVFRADPRSPPRLVTLVFTAGTLACLPLLLGAWLSLGGNLKHLPQALGSAPLSHALFVGSVLAMEGLFFLYYTRWNLFQVLPVAVGLGGVAFYSGSRALSEVQERRLKGVR